MENNVKNIRDLPRVEEVLNENLLILEDQQGTKSIEFSNFVVGPRNVSFYNPMATNIRSLCTYCTSLCSTIETNNKNVVNTVNTRFTEATGALVARFPDFVYTTGTIAILKNSDYTETTFTLPVADVDVECLNFTAITTERVGNGTGGRTGNGVPTIAVGLRNTPTVVGGQTVYTYTMTVTSSFVIQIDAQAFQYSVFKPLIPIAT